MKSVVMVCVTRQKNCARLIELGARLAKKNDKELLVVHALRKSDKVLGVGNEAEALERLFVQATDNGGSLMVVRSDDIASVLVSTAQKYNASVIILGTTPASEPVSLATRLRAMMPDMEIISVDGESSTGAFRISMNV